MSGDLELPQLPNERECLRTMAEEIREGILNLSSSESDKTSIEKDIDVIIERSAREQYSEAAVGLLLFRKYADIANDIKFEKQNLNKNSFDLAVFDPSALVLHEINEDNLAGTLALGEKIFWLRVLTSVLAFISMVVMASISGISNPKLCPARNFANQCDYYGRNECFHQETYMYIIVTAAILIPHNLFFACYYLLPTDDNRKKVVPGICTLFSFPTYITPLFDIFLLTMTLLAGILGSFALQAVQHFKFHHFKFNKDEIEEGYYTIASFYAKFSHTTPTQCTRLDQDPSPRMSASVTLMYLAACLMGLCFAASFNHFWKEHNRQEEEQQSTLSELNNNRVNNRVKKRRNNTDMHNPMNTCSEHDDSVFV